MHLFLIFLPQNCEKICKIKNYFVSLQSKVIHYRIEINNKILLLTIN